MSARPTANEVFREAQRLIKMGQPVFPCWSVDHGKIKAKQPIAQLVPNGVKNATLDVDRVKEWLKHNRAASLGLATGVLWDVLDVDVKTAVDGRKHVRELQELGLLNGCQRFAKTPGGGYHLYFKATPGMTNKGNAKLGLDVRASGGYVLVPPSYIQTVSSEGMPYEGAYTDMGEIVGGDDTPLLWDLIVANLSPKDEITNQPIVLLRSERRASVAALREWVSELSPGERNNGMFWAVCRCIENGIDPHELVEAALLTGLSEDEIMKSVNSAMKRAGLAFEELDSEMEAMFSPLDD